MAVIEITDVTVPNLDTARLWGAAVDAPVTGSHIDAYSVKLAGWVLGRSAPVVAIEVVHEDRLVRSIPTYALHGGDGAGALGRADRPSAPTGFWGAVGVLGWPPEFKFFLRAVLKEGNAVPLATIRGRHHPLRSGFTPVLRPLMVTALGRSGTTWLMRLLAEFPRIVVHRRYPYEFRAAKYLAHMLKVVSEPADHLGSSRPDNFHNDLHWVGHNPFNSEFAAGHHRLTHWFGRTYVEQLAAFCQQSIDECYLQIADDQSVSEPRFFAEKLYPDHTSRLICDIYPETREIFMVRDFRDMFSSMLAFNAKRGTASFGSARASNDDEFVAIRRECALDLLRAWRQRSAHAHLLRYEDLVTSPQETLAALCQYLELDMSASDIEQVIRRAETASTELSQHRTTPSPRASIGRWRHDLAPSLRASCQEAFADVLTAFGYDREGAA